MKFVFGKPALALGKTLVVADLHLGIEFALREKKIFVPLQAKRVARELNALLAQTRCSELAVIGDAKHDVYGFEEREKRMMREFFGALECERVLVVKGNHDSQLNELTDVEKLVVAPPQGVVLRVGGKKFGLAHGHAWPSAEVLRADWLLTAHVHPVVEFREPVGKWRAPVWLVGWLKASKKFGTRKQRAIVFPAFSSFVGGIRVNREPLIGPLFENKLFDVARAQAFSLNGLRLGEVRSMRSLRD